MTKDKTRLTVSRLSTAIFITLLSIPSAAAEIALKAYLEIPLGGDNPFFGLSVGPDAGTYSGVDENFSETPRMGFELRYGLEGSPAFLVNGIPITRSLIINASDDGESHATKNDFDWRVIVGTALGIGLIVAIANADDASVNICSGSNCPPNEKPPPEPEPTNSSKGN